jgi:hypothetical protein
LFEFLILGKRFGESFLDCFDSNLSSEGDESLDVFHHNESDGDGEFNLFFFLGIEGGPLRVFFQKLIFDCDSGKVNGEGSLPVKTDVFPNVLGRFEDELESGINVLGIQLSGVCV